MSTDVAGASGGRFTFSPGESSKEITIAVNSDNIPESDESLIVELYSAEGIAVLLWKTKLGITKCGRILRKRGSI